MWATLLADLKAIVARIEAAVEADASAFWTALKTIVSTDAQKLANDFWPDLEQIGINIQNTQGGINLQNFIPAFIAAAVPVAEKEALTILETDWNIIANAVAGKLNISTTMGNAGNVG